MQITPTERHGPVGLTPSSRTILSPLQRGGIVFSGSGFLGGWQELNAASTISHCIQQVEASGAVDNLRRLVGESDAPFRGPLFADSDVYKTLEAIAWEIGRSGTTSYDEFANDVIRLIGCVQAEDGYINAWVQGGMSDEKLSAMRWSHELYCLGHLLQAAIAFTRTTGRRDLLETAIRFVDLIERELGPGQRTGLDGHPEIETALVELWRLTGERRFLVLAKHFIDGRGHQSIGSDHFGSEYFIDHEPIREVTEAAGHAVRQLYLAAGATDLVIEQSEGDLEAALERIWTSVHHQKMYVTGGVGSRHRGEAFGDPYELPTERAYAETCAAIANFMWNWRMLLRTGESRFADEMERGLYNVIPASTSISGTEFFYVNPLQLREGHRSEENATTARRGWFGCACCPPNISRLIASIDTYAATSTDRGVQLHLYSDGSFALGDGPDAQVATISTEYPWDGRVKIALERALDIELRLRVPGWARQSTVTVDGVPAQLVIENGYLILPPGSATESVELDFHAEPVLVYPHPRLDASRGTVAVQRGPVIYCLEQVDLPQDVDSEDVYLSEATVLHVAAAPEGSDTPAITASGAAVRESTGEPLSSGVRTRPGEREIGRLTLVPYFRWGNRRQAAMRVWIPTR
jgi:DUF1680 family protein